MMLAVLTCDLISFVADCVLLVESVSGEKNTLEMDPPSIVVLQTLAVVDDLN